jgi:hypothetical protein
MKHAIMILFVAFCFYCGWQVAPRDIRDTVKTLVRKHATFTLATILLCALAVVLAYYLTATKVL